MKFTNRRIANTIIISTLLVASIASIGFSSWLIGGGDSNNKGDINVTFGDVVEPNLRNAISYIENSEDGFEYYIYDNNFYFTETSYSIRLKVSPYLLADYITTYPELYLSLGLEYSCPVTNQFDIFSSTNVNTVPPKRVQYCLELNDSFYMESEDCIFSSYTSGSNIVYGLSSKIAIFGNDNSLYYFTKKYQKTTEFVYLTAKYDFELKDEFINNIEKYKSLSMNFYVSIGGSAS